MSIEGGDCADRAENGEEEEECVEIEPWPLPPLPSRSCSAASFSLASAAAEEGAADQQRPRGLHHLQPQADEVAVCDGGDEGREAAPAGGGDVGGRGARRGVRRRRRRRRRRGRGEARGLRGGLQPQRGAPDLRKGLARSVPAGAPIRGRRGEPELDLGRRGAGPGRGADERSEMRSDLAPPAPAPSSSGGREHRRGEELDGLCRGVLREEEKGG